IQPSQEEGDSRRRSRRGSRMISQGSVTTKWTHGGRRARSRCHSTGRTNKCRKQTRSGNYVHRDLGISLRSSASSAPPRSRRRLTAEAQGTQRTAEKNKSVRV